MDISAEVRGALMYLHVHEYMYGSYMYMYDVFYNNGGILKSKNKNLRTGFEFHSIISWL